MRKVGLWWHLGGAWGGRRLLSCQSRGRGWGVTPCATASSSRGNRVGGNGGRAARGVAGIHVRRSRRLLHALTTDIWREEEERVSEICIQL